MHCECCRKGACNEEGHAHKSDIAIDEETELDEGKPGWPDVNYFLVEGDLKAGIFRRLGKRTEARDNRQG